MRNLIRTVAVAAGCLAALLVPAAAASARTAQVSGPVSDDYGSVTTGYSQVVTLTDYGGVATWALKITLARSAAFSAAAGTCAGASLAPHTSCRVTIRHAPADPGHSHKATLHATSSGSPIAASLTALRAASTSHLYWAKNGGTITRANLNGTRVTRLVARQAGPVGVAVGSSHLYWADNNSGTIMAANLNGTGVTTLVTGQQSPTGVAVNSSHIYWASYGGNTIRKANLTGTGVATLVSGQTGPVGMAVNSSHIYWTNLGGGTIVAANLNGTGVTTLVSGQLLPEGVAVGPQ